MKVLILVCFALALFAEANAAWSAWQSLNGVNLIGTPAVININSWRLEVFARGQDNMLKHIWHEGNSWSNWQNLYGQISTDPVVEYIWDTDKYEVFARGTDGELKHIWMQSDRSWSPWYSLGAPQTGLANYPPAVTKLGKRFDVYAIGGDNFVWRLTQREDTGWGTWTRIGDQAVAGPVSATRDAEGRIVISASNVARTHMVIWYFLPDGGVYSPHYEQISYSPDFITIQNGPVYGKYYYGQPASFYQGIFWFTSSNGSMHTAWDQYRYRGTVFHGGNSRDKPVIAYRPDGSYAVLTRSTSNTLQMYENGVWTDLGGNVGYTPAVGYVNSKLEVFVISYTKTGGGILQHKWEL